MSNETKKVCSYAVASVYFSIFCFVLVVVMMVLGGLHIKVWEYFEAVAIALILILPLIGFFLGLISFVRISLRNTTLKGRWLAVTGIILPLLLLVLIYRPTTCGDINKARVSGIIGDLRTIKTSALSYKADVGGFPPDGAGNLGFVANSNATGWNGPYLEKWPKRDPWGGVYLYHNDNKFAYSDKPMIYVTATKVPMEMAKKIDKQLDDKVDLDKGIVQYYNDELYFLIDGSQQ